MKTESASESQRLCNPYFHFVYSSLYPLTSIDLTVAELIIIFSLCPHLENSVRYQASQLLSHFFIPSLMKYRTHKKATFIEFLWDPW